ncbi:MAG: hypothetical protein ACYDDE_02140 [bacterium]
MMIVFFAKNKSDTFSDTFLILNSMLKNNKMWDEKFLRRLIFT